MYILGLKDPVLIRLDVDTKLSENLDISYYSVRKDDKISVLLHVLENNISKNELTVIFVATKHHVEYLKEIINSAIHGVEVCIYIYVYVHIEVCT